MKKITVAILIFYIPRASLKKNLKDYKIQDFELVLKIIKGGIYEIEQKFNCVFKETILVINNFENLLINFSGFKN